MASDNEKSMEQFLRERGVPERLLEKMRDEKIGPDIILIMDDLQMAEFLPKYGDRIALKQFCKINSDETFTSTRKQTLLEKLREKIKRNSNVEDADDEHKIKKTKSNNNFPDKKQIEIGWLCCMAENQDKYVQVRQSKGGGTRKVKVSKFSKKEDILKIATNFFFPNGVSPRGVLDKFTINLFDFKNNEIDDDVTVIELLNATGLTKLRFYLATKEKREHQFIQNRVISNIDRPIHPIQETIPETSSNYYYSVDTEDECEYLETSTQVFNVGEEETVHTVEKTCSEVQAIDSGQSQSNNGLDQDFSLLVESILNESDYSLVNVDNLNIEIEPDNSNQENKKKPESVTDILHRLQSKISTEKISKFNVFRNDIFNCCLRAMRRKTFSPFQKIYVKFSDSEGMNEGAIDEGGPTREMFRLVLNFLKDSQLFIGTTKKNVTLHNGSLENRYYYEAGRIMALSLVHGGPGPRFFSKTLYSVVAYGAEKTVPTLEDVEEEIQSKLKTFQETADLLELQNFIISENIFSIAGWSYIRNIEEKMKIVQDTLRFYALNRTEGPVNQLIEGLRTCEVYDYIKMYPDMFRTSFCENAIISADELDKLFMIEYSEAGSNKREHENRAISYFRDYILDCEENINDDPDEQSVTLTDILVFVTGADCIPPLGFQCTPRITFLHDDINTSKFPMANTCALELKLPTIHFFYDDFKTNMDFGIANCKCFGLP